MRTRVIFVPLSFIAVWGPFLIISPASTLHNWQQEMARFVPMFKVVPYWGNPQERKILRQFWDTKDLHTKEASFHVVITSYQLVITDYKYFNRIKWQYMILDEAQAIKSTSRLAPIQFLVFIINTRYCNIYPLQYEVEVVAWIQLSQ